VTSHGCMARMPRSVPTKRLLRLPRLTNGLGVTSVESVDRASRPAEPMRVGHLAKAPKRRSGLLATTAYVLSILAANPARAQEPPAVAVDSVRGVPRVVNLARSPADLPQLRLRELWRVGGLDAPPEGQFVGPFFAVVLELTAQQLEDIRAARHEMRNPGNFAAVLIQSIHGIDGGRVLVQVGRDPDEPSSEFDLYSPEGVLEGVVHSPIPVHHRSELSSRGDTILFIGVGEYDVPLLVKAVLERWRPHRR
jgi:hypothetical protein